MDKIKCPHCGAINQDVTEQDLCWQCQKPLSTKVEIDRGPEAPVGHHGGQVQKSQPTLEERVAARKQARKEERRINPVIPIIVTLVILILLIILYLLFIKR